MLGWDICGPWTDRVPAT
ncbi:hypothetical protein LINPERPRIM_LOCUS2038 [Linum perenne]